MIQLIKDFGDGWFVDADHRLACKKTSKLTDGRPHMIVLHWTAAPYIDTESNLARVKRWAANDADKSSTHFSIGRDGVIHQLVPTTLASWNAGKSIWRCADGVQGKTSVNLISIGIDFDLVGPLTKSGNDWLNCYKGKHTGPVAKADDGKYYEPPTDAQMYACRILLDALRQKYSISLCDIVGHVDVSPGRKIDPGPFVTRRNLGLE